MQKNTLYFRQKRHAQGFTIIETLVAIFILLVATTGPLGFVQTGLRSSFTARDQIVAFYLAQDAIETIKNQLDNTYISSSRQTNTNWLVLLDACEPTIPGPENTVVCGVEVNSTIKYESCSETCPPLKYINSGTKGFVSDSNLNGDVSRYTRTLYVTEIVDEKELQVVVKVSWDTNFFGEREIIVQENLYKKY